MNRAPMFHLNEWTRQADGEETMGDWGCGSMENDWALEWVANNVEYPTVMAIRRTLERFLAIPTGTDIAREDVTQPEAEAAVALLVQYALPADPNAGPGEYCINLGHTANRFGLWALASKTIRRLLGESEWLDSWGNRAAKESVLESLFAKVEDLAACDWP